MADELTTPAADDATGTPAAEDGSTGTPADPTDTHPLAPKIPDGVQKRINKAMRKQHGAERKAEELEKKLTTARASAPEDTGAEPVEDDFDTHGEFIRALTLHSDKKNIATIRDTVAEEVSRLQEEQTATNLERDAQAKFNRGRKEHKDFDEVALNNEVFTPAMKDAVMRSENADKLAYHLGSHPEVADRIAKMDPVTTAMELGRIEARLVGSTSRSTDKQPSGAPDPVVELGDGDEASKKLMDMTLPEYIKERGILPA
ncbi:hypothetical protein LCGC14_1340540 [marine sediment metagenome]|uniref:Uncharacterized protein n=1 Tax=marine sediment metagenome TaxID=412755 RepID=A0A0F9KDP3_9ZZZZ